MARAGRKRKSGQRKPSGDIKRNEKDMASANRIKRRMDTMGDISLSPDYPLAVLLSRKKITRGMYIAGMRFGSLHARIFGSSHSSGPAWARMYRPPDDGTPVLSMPPTPEDDMLAEAHYAACLHALDGLPEPIPARTLMFRFAVYLTRDWYIRDVGNHNAGSPRHYKRTGVIREALQALVDMDRMAFEQLANLDGIIPNALAVSDRHEPTPRVA